MKLVRIMVLSLALTFVASAALCASIQYVATGHQSREIKITFSRNNGGTWQGVVVKPGSTYVVPNDATHLTIDGVPRDPKKNYKIKDGNVF